MSLMVDLTRVAPEPLLKTKATPLEFLEAVYQDENLPLNVRLRAAVEAAPYVHPKLSATAIVHEDGSFAERLERAVERSRKVIDHVPAQLEAKPEPL